MNGIQIAIIHYITICEICLKIKMSAILLNSESNLSHPINNDNLESDSLSDEGLFNSLFVIISQKSEDNLILENNPSIDQENLVADNLNIENQENSNELFSLINGNILLNDFKKVSNIDDNKKNFPTKNQPNKEHSLEIKFEIINTTSKKEFLTKFSDVVKNINDKSLVKTISITSVDQKFEKNEFIDYMYKKNNNPVVNIKENTEEISLNRLKFNEFKTGLDNVGTKYVDQDLFLKNNKNKNLVSIINSVDLNKGIKSIKNQNFSKYENNNTNQVNTITQNNNIFNQYSGSSFTGSNFAGNNSFYSGSGNSLEYLNMLDRNWSTSLLNKIEKGIKNGDETLEISLKPRNLGNLKISLSLNNDSAKINIVTENSSAALLLSEAESKLSQMLENSGLKLSNLSTSSDQGKKHNTKNGNQDNTEKKMLAKDEISLEKGDQLVSKINSENQILNLLA